MHAHHQQQRRPGHKRAAGWIKANPHGPVVFRLAKQFGWPSRHSRLPDFLGLGTQKGGTTSLQKLLEQHPGVYLPPCKEVHYFSLHAEQPADWYAAHYRDALWWQRKGDITPYYLFHPQALNGSAPIAESSADSTAARSS